jgi:hypothetical protein
MVAFVTKKQQKRRPADWNVCRNKRQANAVSARVSSLTVAEAAIRGRKLKRRGQGQMQLGVFRPGPLRGARNIQKTNENSELIYALTEKDLKNCAKSMPALQQYYDIPKKFKAIAPLVL